MDWHIVQGLPNGLFRLCLGIRLESYFSSLIGRRFLVKCVITYWESVA